MKTLYLQVTLNQMLNEYKDEDEQVKRWSKKFFF